MRIDGPAAVPGAIDPWKVLTTLILIVAVLPIALGFWMLLMCLRLALTMLGIRGSGRGRGLFAEIMAFHVIGALFHRGDPVPVYHYVLDTETGHRSARQEGELATGRIFVGNHIALAGRERAGSLVIEDGYNETLGARLLPQRSGWRWAFPVALILALAEYGAFWVTFGGVGVLR